MNDRYGFIVDTDAYAGNFERELCAFITGHIGECGVGEEYAEMYMNEHELIEGIIDVMDDNGCARPVEIYPAENVWNNGFGFAYKEGEEKIALAKYKESVRLTNESAIERVMNNTSWTEEVKQEQIAIYIKRMENADVLTEPVKYPAYNSVLIHFDEKPSDEAIDLMKSRASMFSSVCKVKWKDMKFNIIGFRLYKCVSLETFESI